MNELQEYAVEIFAPKDPQTVTEWCEANLVMPLGPFAGSAFRVRNAPYMEFILDQVSNPNIKRITVKAGTQLGKSTILLLALLWSIRHEPSTALYVTAIANDAKSVSKNIFKPIVDNSAELTALKPSNLKEEFQHAEQKFINGALCYWVGAQSTNALSSKPIRLLLADEIRSYKTDASGIEADPLNLALNRVKSYPNHKVLLASSPTVSGVGISLHHTEGSQHEYRLPCPHCDHKQKLNFDQMKWDPAAKVKRKWDKAAVKKSVVYECIKCKGAITEKHKTKMLRSGTWVQTNFDCLPENISVHLSSLYSVSIPWAEIVLKFLESKSTIGGLKDFVQNYLGEDWVEKTEAVTDLAELSILKRDYSLGDLHEGKVLMTVDVQQQTLKYVIRQFSSETSWLVDYGEVVTFESIRELEAKYGVESVMVDTGYRSTEVYEEVFKSKSWMGSKGWNQTKMPEPFKLVHFDPFSGTRNQGRYKIKLVHLNTNTWKSEIIKCLRGEKDWLLPEYIGEDYMQEMLNEIPVEMERKDGTKYQVWQKNGKQDWFDCEVYLLALDHMITGKPRSEVDKPKPIAPRFSGFSL